MRNTTESSSIRLAFFLGLAAFGAYFSMYAFRKPFAAGSYTGLTWYGLDYKAVLIMSQLLGYFISKVIGIKLISELTLRRRIQFLIGLLTTAFLTLIGFALVPLEYKVLMLFLNGMPLGMVFGVVFSFLEGRRFTELMSLGLGTSIIFASGAVKSVGLILLQDYHVSQWWMPAITGLIFVPVLIVSILALKYLPPPSPEDIAQRKARLPMTNATRKTFFLKHALTIISLVVIYISLTVCRDLRDNFAVEIWTAIGFFGRSDLLASSELYISLIILLAVGSLSFIRKNETAFQYMLLAMVLGGCMYGGSTLAFQKQIISAQTWMIASGFGLFLSYTIFQGILFDRMLATMHEPANVGFLVYFADAFGYLGSIAVIFYKNYGQVKGTLLQYYFQTVYSSSLLTICLSLFVLMSFYRRSSQRDRVQLGSNISTI